MNRTRMFAAVLLLCGGAALAEKPVKMTDSNAAQLRQAGAEILFWDQAQRDAGFPAMEKQFPGDVIKAGKPYKLPAGAPLSLGAGDPAADYTAANNVAGLLVLQDGKIRMERYARGYSAKGRYTSFSVAKSVTSTLVGAAIEDGFIKSVDDPVTRYIPELAGSGYDGVTVKQILTMTSGVAWNEDYTDPKSDVASMFSIPLKPGEDATIAYLRTLKREAEPGTKWVYKTGETNLIGVLVTKATGKTLAAYLEEKIWKPFGMEQDAFWMTDTGGQDVGGCCLSVSLRDYGRIGQLVLNGGMIGGKRVVPADWFEQATHKQADIGTPGRGYGYQWWTVDDGSFMAVGIFGQTIYIDPASKLVVVMSSAWPKATDPALSAARVDFIQSIRAAAAVR